jgi:transcriptional regulator with XRE-family HTH domain
MRRTYAQPRRRAEAAIFSAALRRLREESDWTQAQLANRLGVSVRTLSNWECGYWLPPFKQRLHVVLAMHDAPPAYVLTIADALGVSVDPVVARFLAPFREALDDTTTAATGVEAGSLRVTSPVAPPVPVAPPRPAPDALRAAVDPIVLAASNTLDARPNDVRAIVARVIEACGAMGGTLEDAAEAVRRTTKSN